MKKIAVPINDGKLSEHFGQAKEFYFYQIKNNKIVDKKIIIPPQHSEGVIPKWIRENGGNEIIAGSMGQKAINLFNKFEVNVHVGAPIEDGDTLVKTLLSGDLHTEINLCDH